MTERPDFWRECPTRPDGAEVLIAHKIAPATCAERQQRGYHKCPSCLHRSLDVHAGRSGLGQLARPGQLPPRELTPNPAPARQPGTRERVDAPERPAPAQAEGRAKGARQAS